MPTTQLRHTRPPLDRVWKIHDRLQNATYPNCVALARELEVSVLTLKRDIAFMRDRLKLPIEYDERRHGFFYSQPVDRFPEETITEMEMFALLVADKAIAQYHGTPFQKPLRMAFRKLAAKLDSAEPYSMDKLEAALSFRPLAPEDTDLRSFEIITSALRERCVLKFDYRNLGTRGMQVRQVQPYHLACIENHWYLFAHDVDRQAIRTFALTRLSEPVLLAERFIRPENFNPDEYLRNSFTVMKGQDDYEVVILFDSWATDLIRGRMWHSSQRLTELPGGGSQLQLRLSGLEEIEGWVLNWGIHATVLRPRILAERVFQTVGHLLERYREQLALGQ
jgi:proteasome accessory factor B